MEDLRDELDASVLFGSGYICVVGPPSSGKTTLVLDYLVARERQFNAARRSGTPVHGGTTAPTFCLEYVSARSAANELLRCLMRRLHPDARTRRLSYECTPLEFGASLIQWLESHAEGSELHVVLDDADLLDYEVEEMNLWLSHCLRASAAQTRNVMLWMISELPLRIANCFRFHFVARPDPQSIVRWLQQQYESERRVCAEEEEEKESEAKAEGGCCAIDAAVVQSTVDTKSKSVSRSASSAPPLVTVSADAVQRVVLEAFQYYATRQPMRASVVSRDVRLLVQRVYQILPPLLLESYTPQPTSTPAASKPASSAAAAAEGTSATAADTKLATTERKLNARHFAAAWGQHRSGDGNYAARGDGSGGSAYNPIQSHNSSGGVAAVSQDPLVMALKRLGYAAVLLAFAAFYAGAVPKRKQHQVFGRLHGGERKGALQHEAQGQSHKAAVLTASAHVLTVRRLAFLYDAMLRMCVPHIDPLEFTTAEVALQYVQAFVAWGLLTPVVTQRHRSYHCWIPVSTAQQLARELSLSLFDLIPS